MTEEERFLESIEGFDPGDAADASDKEASECDGESYAGMLLMVRQRTTRVLIRVSAGGEGSPLASF